MRERPMSDFVEVGATGITPAYAGKTTLYLRVCEFQEDHPRVCGKDLLALRGRLLAMGSPPRMRERL